MKIRVMHFNILNGGMDLEPSLKGVVEAIRCADPDVVAILEANGSENEIGKLLNAEVYTLKLCHRAGNTISVLSKFPIVEFLDAGITIQIAQNRLVAIFCAQLTPDPYEPYLCRDIPEYSDTACINSAKRHIDQVSDITSKFDDFCKRGIPVVFCCDTNEPSHLDWTERARSIHLNRAIEWPTSKFLQELGMVDSYRAFYPDELSKPGITWTPITELPKQFSADQFSEIRQKSGDAMPLGDREVLDRLDFIYCLGANISVLKSFVVGENIHNAEVAYQPWASDHRAVVSEFEIHDD